MTKNEIQNHLYQNVDEIIGKTYKNLPEFCKQNELPFEKISGGTKRMLDAILAEMFTYAKVGHKIHVKDLIWQPPERKRNDDYLEVRNIVYSYLDSQKAQNPSDYYIFSNRDIVYYGELTEGYQNFYESIENTDDFLKSFMNRIIDQDYRITKKDIIGSRIQSFARNDIFNEFTQIWMCAGKEITSSEAKDFLESRVEWIEENYGKIFLDEAGKIVLLNEVEFGTTYDKATPRNLVMKATFGANEVREEKGLDPIYRGWKVIYNRNPYLSFALAHKAIAEKRFELVDKNIAKYIINSHFIVKLYEVAIKPQLEKWYVTNQFDIKLIEDELKQMRINESNEGRITKLYECNEKLHTNAA